MRAHHKSANRRVILPARLKLPPLVILPALPKLPALLRVAVFAICVVVDVRARFILFFRQLDSQTSRYLAFK